MKNTNKLKQFILGVPKAELHVHIEGTLEPEMMFEIANGTICHCHLHPLSN
jgi:adenosine deaminase